MPKPWYSIRARRVNAAEQAPTAAEVFIYGDIGESWWDETVTARDFVKEIAALDVEQLTVRINSVGGSVPDGLAIYNALKRHKASVTIAIDGMAMSIASLIAMAGDTVEMAENALLMIHAPWTYAGGNSADLRETADMLDKWAEAMSTSYAAKTGKPQAEMLALLTDGADHYYTAAEAKTLGFVDEVVSAIPVSASAAIPGAALARYPSAAARLTPHVPAAPAASQPKEAQVPDPVNPQAAATQPAPAAAAPAAFARTREMNDQVRAMFKPFLAQAGMQDLLTDSLADPALTVEQIQAKLLAKMGEGAEPANPKGAHARVEAVEDEADKKREAGVQALLVRAGVETDAKVRASLASNPFRGHSLMDMARASLQRAGRSTDGMDKLEVVAAAFTQSGSDFPVLLENTMHKALQRAYATAALTWNRFCATGSVSDFRAHNRYRLGSFGSLDAVNELSEFTNKAIPDGEKSSITASTKGNIINLSRQAIINDDLGAFVGLSAMLGRAAARTVEADVYALLALNSGLGPVMGDGKTLFHADHGNIGTGSALSVSGLDADRVLMASQRDISGNDYLDLRPSVLLVPIGLGGTARVINGAQYDPDTANKLQRPNMVAGLFSDIVDTPRLTGTRRYLFADAGEAPVIEVAFLDGAQEPYLEQQNGFDVDGSRWKVRMDYGVAAVDFRGAITNAGA